MKPPSEVQPPLPSCAWSQDPGTVCTSLQVEPTRGLSTVEADRRRRIFGPNRLRRHSRRSLLSILTAQFKSVILALLAAAAILAFAFGDNVEGAAVVAVILINAGLGFVMELRAVRSIEALRQLSSVEATVLRDATAQTIAAEAVVPGDLILVEAGDSVTSDVRLLEASRLKADESTLTGESLPVGKDPTPVALDAALAERRCMLYKGSSITRGSGLGVVVATGMQTELGRISALVEEAEDETTPLEERLRKLGGRLVWLTIGIVGLLIPFGIATGKDALVVVKTAVVLAVAAVPEGLPIVATIALARGMWRMARRNALLDRLSAVETLGSTSVIFSDKTGTLTENSMTVTRLVWDGPALQVGGSALALDGPLSLADAEGDPLEREALRRALEVGVLCTNASIAEGAAGLKTVGDPMEVALVIAAAKAGIRQEEIDPRLPELREEAFDPATRMMATVHRAGSAYRVAVKGAPEAVIESCSAVLTDAGLEPLDDALKLRWKQRCAALAAQGLRLLAAADKTAEDPGERPYQALTLLAVFAMQDPPRTDVREALAQCARAGIRVVMATGDLAETAGNIARAVGLTERPETCTIAGAALDAAPSDAGEEAIRGARIVARCSPEHKLRLVERFQAAGEVVAMIGDGVNDAPALKKADIGVAMGGRGTQVAKEAADMVIRDDRFATIVTAVEQGRIIFDNIRNFVLYLMATNGSEILLVTGATVLALPLPLLPLQILFLNLLADVFPALALGFGEARGGVLLRPPRPRDESVLMRRHWVSIAGWSVGLAASVLGAFVLALHVFELEAAEAVTVSFIGLALGQLFHVFNLRQPGSSLFLNSITRNRWVWGALAVCTVLILAAVYYGRLAGVLGTVVPGDTGWMLILGSATLPLVVGQVKRSWGRSTTASGSR